MKDQQGIAMLSVMLMLILISALGIAATTITGLENRVAGFASTMESSSAAAESCVQTGVRVIQQVMDVSNAGSIPTALLSNQIPQGPVPATNKTQLELEIMGDAAAVLDAAVWTRTAAVSTWRHRGGSQPIDKHRALCSGRRH